MGNNNSKKTIGVLGAGIMGCCLALELASRGYKTDLIDLASMPMTGASLHNEGKLHLGFVYANDPQEETYLLMLRGSLSFAGIIERLTGTKSEFFLPSEPFHYFVPVDSQLSLEEITVHFGKVDKVAQQVIALPENHYFAKRYDCFFEQNPPGKHDELFSPEKTLGSFRTVERSVSTVAVAKILSQAVRNHPGINFIPNTVVDSVRKNSAGEVEVKMSGGGNSPKMSYPCVANCLWDDKLRVDNSAGIHNPGPWMMRYKATVTIKNVSGLNGAIPSATGILGSYGDVVSHNNGDYYISWYPLSKRVQSITEDGRKLHDQIHTCPFSRGVRKLRKRYPLFTKSLAALGHKRFVKNNINEMAAFVPSMAKLLKEKKHVEVGGGVIVARGQSDINDPTSYLHQRLAVGPVAYDNYISIDTGKYCLAPLFATEAADMIDNIV